jgi:hypothetical protein
MHTRYTDFQYLFPPRTEMKIPPGPGPVRSVWERFSDAIGQFKVNGTRNILYVYPDGHIECWNRHGEQQKQYSLTPSMRAQVLALGLPRGVFHVLDGELLHSKTKTVKDVLYMFDILVYNGEYLLGDTYGQRYQLLHDLLTPAGIKFFPLDFHPEIGHMYLAENYPASSWDWMWRTAQPVDYCEGMVLKRTGIISGLATGYREINNSGFMLRVRKGTKNYGF